jgi:cytochrome P450
MEQAVRNAVDAALDRLAATSHPDFMVDFASKFPAEVVYTLMGIPRSDWVKVFTLSQSFLSAGEPGEESLFNEERMGAMLELIGYFSELSAVKRESTDDDIITRMIQTSYVDEQGVEQKLSDLEMGGYLLQLLAASVESSAKLMTATYVLLHRHGLWQRILDDPSLIPAALSEAGRLEPPVQFLGRKTQVDVTLHGVTIPAGSSVLLLIAAANRDERVYVDPESFRIERVMRTQPMTFGMGPHACMGKHLGELEGRIALEEFGKRFPHAEIIEERLERARAIHVFGWKNVPLRLG